MNKDKILIRKDILNNKNISDEAIAVYCALCKYYTLHLKRDNFVSYLSIEYLEHLLFGKIKIKGVNGVLKKALDNLIDFGFIKSIEILRGNSGVYDMTSLLVFDKKKYYVDITIDELNTIMKVKYTKFCLLRYFLNLICSFETSCSIDEKYRFKVSATSIDTLSKSARLSPTTVMKYNSILVKNKIIYISRSYGVKNASGGLEYSVSQISNVYSRYVDRKICNNYAKKISVSYKKEAYKVHKEVNTSRKYIQMYNQMLKGREYDLETVKEIYSYVKHWNYKKREEHMNKHGDENGLENKLKDLDIFQKYNLD